MAIYRFTAVKVYYVCVLVAVADWPCSPRGSHAADIDRRL